MKTKELLNCGLPMLIALTLLLLASATGCSTTQQTAHTEELLLSSGFKVVAAATPAHKAQLQTLRPGKITLVNRNGKLWYVYPDPAGQKLYVGNASQYQAYRQAFQDDRIVKAEYESIQLSEDTAYWSTSVYGDFGE